jgi:hypothetical protein
MTDASATFRDVISLGGRMFALGDCRRAVRRLVRGLCIGLGIALVACALVATVTVAAAWIVRSTLNTNPHLHRKAAFRMAAAKPVDDYPRSIAGNQLADLQWMPQVAMEPTDALDALIFDATPFGVATSAFAPSGADVVAPPRPLQVASAPAAAPDSAPPQLDLERGDGPPLPRSRPASYEPDPVPPGEATSRVALATPGPAAIPEQNAPRRQGDNKPVTPLFPDSGTAVYDISARRVYLPNGERLEAHSGFGDKMDDPRHVRVRMRGPTPPNVYNLTMRERLFHGVQAVRLNPVDESRMFGRDGMLAHSYLLGPSGQSHGCVSFKDYPKFLRAVTSGEVDRLIVVPRLEDASFRTLSALARASRRYAENNR